MLSVQGISVFYGVIPAVADVSFHVEKGEIVSLIGANGAGKSTILRCISGIKHPKSGSVYLGEIEITSMPAHKIVGLGVSHVPEGRGIFPNLSVQENLFLGAYLRKDQKEIEANSEWVFSTFPRIKERRKQLAGTLSGGELQMLAIARAVMSNPRYLLLDEPSMGLSPVMVDEVFKTIIRLNKNRNVSILLVEQNALMALHVSNRTYVLETGSITVSGQSSQLLEQEDIKRAYLGL